MGGSLRHWGASAASALALAAAAGCSQANDSVATVQLTIDGGAGGVAGGAGGAGAGAAGGAGGSSTMDAGATTSSVDACTQLINWYSALEKIVHNPDAACEIPNNPQDPVSAATIKFLMDFVNNQPTPSRVPETEPQSICDQIPTPYYVAHTQLFLCPAQCQQASDYLAANSDAYTRCSLGLSP